MGILLGKSDQAVETLSSPSRLFVISAGGANKNAEAIPKLLHFIGRKSVTNLRGRFHYPWKS